MPFGFFMNWSGAQAGEGFEFHLLALALSLPLMIKGGGAWSLDSLLARVRLPLDSARNRLQTSVRPSGSA